MRRKKNQRQKVKMRSSLRRFHKKYFFSICISILNISTSVFYYQLAPFFAWLYVKILFFYAFSTIIEPFSGDVFVLNYTGTRKKSQNKVSKWQDFSPQDFFSPKIQQFISENFFSENFPGGYHLNLTNQNLGMSSKR